MVRRIFLSLIFCTAFLVNASGGTVWKAGFSRTIITPGDPIWLAGFASRTAPSNGTVLDIWAKALAIEDSLGNRAVLVTCDILGFPKELSDDIRDHVMRKHGLDRSRIVLSASHTHSGPVLGNSLYFVYPMTEKDRKEVSAYTEAFKKKIISLIDDAMEDMHPALLSSGSGICRFAVNRRNNNAARINSTTDLKGPSDYAVPVLKVEGLTGNTIAVLFGYSCHPTTTSELRTSGDYPGYAQLEIEKAHPGASAMFFQGAGADQNPIPRGKNSFAIQYGRQLAASVEQVLSDDMEILESSLKTKYKEIDLPFDKPLDSARLRRISIGSGYKARWAKAMLDPVDKVIFRGAAYPYPIELWEIGRQKIFIFGGEIVSGYSLRLKEEYGEDTFVMGYANDVMNYIPTTKIWEEGGYEGDIANRVYALPARWEGNVEERILQAIEDMTSE